MKLSNVQSRQNLVNRLRRVEGQVRGVQKMVAEERECEEIVQQLASIRSAVHSTMINLLHDQARDCIYDPTISDSHQQEQMLSDLITLLGKIS
jgi:DNA-binding FrmR family transcriptional regulator